jgi:hypothetical protein
MHKLFLILSLILPTFGVVAQPTWSGDVAAIVYKHCTSCHRPGEIGPMSLTRYEEAKDWAGTIKYVTGQKIMPPWKADPTYAHYLDENYLTDGQIQTIADWVDAGSPEGNPSTAPAPPVFPENSLLGTPDMVLTFKKSYLHKGTGKDEYRYFVLPTGLTQNKKLKAIELRPGNKRIVHHALFFSDQSGKAREYDAKTPEYGFSVDDFADFNAFEVINRDQFPGYVPGQKPRYFPDGLAQNLPAGSDLIIQMHYAPWAVDELDSTTVNLFFADEKEVIERTVKEHIMLPNSLVTGANSFFILPNTVRTFEGRFVVPFDVSLVGIFPHMHFLGTKWEVYVEHANGTKTPLIKIPDWDFNWQGGYYFDRFKIAKKGSVIRAFATYDNTTSNPSNPNDPLRIVTWGEGSKDEMYYLPLLWVPYKSGDESVVFDNETSGATDPETTDSKLNLYPNPVSQSSGEQIRLTFSQTRGMAVSIQLFDVQGKLVRTIREKEFFQAGSHIIYIQTPQLQEGLYTVHITGDHNQQSASFVVIK